MPWKFIFRTAYQMISPAKILVIIICNAPRIKKNKLDNDLSSIALKNVFQNLSTTIYGKTVKQEFWFKYI